MENGRDADHLRCVVSMEYLGKRGQHWAYPGVSLQQGPVFRDQVREFNTLQRRNEQS